MIKDPTQPTRASRPDRGLVSGPMEPIQRTLLSSLGWLVLFGGFPQWCSGTASSWELHLAVLRGPHGGSPGTSSSHQPFSFLWRHWPSQALLISGPAPHPTHVPGTSLGKLTGWGPHPPVDGLELPTLLQILVPSARHGLEYRGGASVIQAECFLCREGGGIPCSEETVTGLAKRRRDFQLGW